MFRRQLLAVIASLALIVAGTSVLAAQGGANAPAAAEPAQANARVTIAHLAPFSATDTTVSLTVNGLPVPRALSYKQSLTVPSLPAGTYQVAVFAGATPGGSPVLTSTLTLAAGGDYTVLAVGDKVGSGAGNIPLQLLVLNNNASPPSAGNFNLRVVHAAPFAPQAQTGVDIVLENGTPIPGLQNVPFGAASPFLQLPAGTPIDIKVLAAGTTTEVFNPDPLIAQAGDTITAVAIGGANGQPAELFLIDQAGQFKLYLPFIANGAAPTGQPTTTPSVTTTVGTNVPTVTAGTTTPTVQTVTTTASATITGTSATVTTTLTGTAGTTTPTGTAGTTTPTGTAGTTTPTAFVPTPSATTQTE